jgi:hypothetical protein
VTRTRAGGPQQRGDVREWHVLQRSLPLMPGSVRLARMTARVACRAWRAPAVEETAALAASEMVTTTLRHAGPGQLTLRVLMTPRRLRLEVHDPSGRLPCDLGDDLASAASVAVLDASTVRWGVACQLPGAQMWAEIAL